MLDGNCDVTIELNSDEKTFKSHETLTGKVIVEVSDDVACDGLTVSVGWKTHGRGNVANQIVRTDTLYAGDWKGGETYEYPFELELPDGPFTYRGVYLNIDWELTANADIPWAFDPSDKVEFVLKPGEVSNFSLGGTTRDEYRQQLPDDDSTISWVALIFGLVMIISGLVPLGISVSSGSILPFLFSVPFIGFGGWSLYQSLQNYVAEKRLGDVDIDLSSNRVTPGETVACTVSMRPNGSVDLNAINLTLKGVEKVVSGHGTNSTTYRSKLHEEQIVVDDAINTTISGGKTVEFSEDITLPETAPFSFDASDNDVIWRIESHIDVPGWPDWEHNELLMVAPFGGDGPTPDQSAENDTTGQTQTDTGRGAEADEHPPDNTDDNPSTNDDFDLETTTDDSEESPEVKW
jgi:hypothetical protein